jgi:hypothetical protein
MTRGREGAGARRGARYLIPRLRTMERSKSFISSHR